MNIRVFYKDESASKSNFVQKKQNRSIVGPKNLTISKKDKSKKIAEFDSVFKQLPPQLVMSYKKKYPWILGLAEQYLDNPAQIHQKWFFFFVKVCRCLGPGDIQMKLNEGRKLYEIIKNADVINQKPLV